MGAFVIFAWDVSMAGALRVGMRILSRALRQFSSFFLVFCSNTDENICGVRISVCEVGSNGTEIIKLRVFSLAILRNENS